MQTPIGLKKAHKTMLEKYGEEGYHEHFRTIGASGGKNGRGHTFAHGKVSPSVAGKIGGAKSRRGKSTKTYSSSGETKWVDNDKFAARITEIATSPRIPEYPLVEHGTIHKLYNILKRRSLK